MATSNFELVTGTQTATGQGSGKLITTNSMGVVDVNITAASGTLVFDLWLEGSNDNGVTWFELFHNGAMKTSGLAAENAPSAAGRPIIDNKTTTTLEKFCAIYPWLACKYIRAAWTLSGTTPSVTFTARFGGK